jgi:hypothetical protein
MFSSLSTMRMTIWLATTIDREPARARAGECAETVLAMRVKRKVKMLDKSV